MDADDILALAAVITALGGFVIGAWSAWQRWQDSKVQNQLAKQQVELAKKQADLATKKEEITIRRNEIDLLRGELERVHSELEEVQRKVKVLERKYEREHLYNICLRDYIQELLRIVRANGLKAPPMPEAPTPEEDDIAIERGDGFDA